MGRADSGGAKAEPGDRVFVLAPLGRDAAVVCQLLGAAGIACVTIGGIADFIAAIRTGFVGAAVATEEALTPAGVAELAASLADQPSWSDLPVLLLLTASERPDTAAARRLAALRAAGNITVFFRPVPGVALVSAIQAALRARRRQFEVGNLIDREHVARLEAERANRLKDEFLAMVSHELQTPLSSILLWTHMAAAGRLDAEEVAKALQMIERSANAQLRLIDDLLDAARMIAGTLRLDCRKCQLEPAARAAVEVIRPIADAKGVQVEVSLDPDAGLVLADPDRVRQVISNLLSNAVKFTPSGGSVRVQLGRENGQVRIRIADTGHGISSEFLPHVFERFRQEDGSLSRCQGGLGLGLSICHQIVELHGGTITAASDGPNKGAVFTAYFPLAHQKTAPRRTVRPHRRPQPQT